jgi:hypothetical protein
MPFHTRDGSDRRSISDEFKTVRPERILVDCDWAAQWICHRQLRFLRDDLLLVFASFDAMAGTLWHEPSGLELHGQIRIVNHSISPLDIHGSRITQRSVNPAAI